MQKDNLVYIFHIRDCIAKIENYTEDITENDFLGEAIIQDAVLRNIEIIGEATKKLDQSFRKKYSEIEWRKIAGLRDKLIHDYMGVDLWAVWAIVQEVLPQFKLQDIIRKEKPNNP